MLFCTNTEEKIQVELQNHLTWLRLEYFACCVLFAMAWDNFVEADIAAAAPQGDDIAAGVVVERCPEPVEG